MTVVAAPFAFLAWSAVRSSIDAAGMEQKVRSSFRPVACEITSSSWTALQSRTGQTSTMVVSGYDVHAQYSYSVDGRPYVSRRIKPHYQTIPTLAEAEAFVARYPIRKAHTCHYDPTDPSVAFLEQ